MITDHFKVYIAGPITNKVDGNKEAFLRMQERLDNKGVDSYNPRSEKPPDYCSENDIRRVMMKIAIKNFFICDAIVLLDDWETSEGTKIEYSLAKYLGYKIYNSNFELIS